MQSQKELEAAAELLSAQEFIERYPKPALLVNVNEDLLGAPDARPLTTSVIPTIKSSADPSLRPGDLAQSETIGADLHAKMVGFLSKTDRNKFRDIVILGRAAFADLRVNVQTISKIHASFTCISGAWHVVHRGATNGLKVNGRTIPSEEYVKLRSGMSLSFGPDVWGSYLSPEDLYELLRSSPPPRSQRS